MASYLTEKYEYSKLRKEFGRQPLFQAVPGHLLDSINSDPTLQKEYGLRNPIHREIQVTVTQAEHDGNTKQILTNETGINHTEGGWPRDIHPDNEEQVLRHRRRILHEENYVHTVLSIAPAMQHYVNQNNAIEMYQSYFTKMPAQEPIENHSVKVMNVFRDKGHRSVSCVVWTNEKQPKLVVTYDSGTYPGECDFDNDGNVLLIWDIHQETEPLLELYADHTCWQLACSPVEPEVIAAGLENGIVNIFDIRESCNAVSSSSVFNSHRGPITSLLYSHSRTNTEFFTGSTDGQVLFWDMRNLSEPIERFPMSVRLAPKEVPNIANSEGISSLQFDRALPTKFLAGTESGLIINVNRLGKTHAETMSCYWYAHNGPVRAVQRSPCTFRMFLSCGDWDVKVWSEEVRGEPIILTRPYPNQVTDIAWAPLRFSSYMAVCEGGYFHYWDLLRRYKDPIVALKVSEHALTKVQPHDEGELVALGDSNGSVFLTQLSDNMTYPGPKDKALMTQIYDRETRREHILDARIREINLKKRQEEEAALASEPSIADEEEELLAVEQTYHKIVQQEMNKFEGMYDGRAE